MKFKKTKAQIAITAVVASACISYSYTAMSALPAGAVLTIDAGQPTFSATYGAQTNVTSGSYFAMDLSGDSKIQGTEKTILAKGTNDGIIIGLETTAGASHTGAPLPNDTNELNAPWPFSGNTGSGQFVPGSDGPTEITSSTIDWTGYAINWNATTIDIGGGTAWQPQNCDVIGCTGVTFANGVADFQWSGVNGDRYILQYTAVVPTGSFTGTQYYVRYEGTVLAPNPSVEIQLEGGNSYECSEVGGSVVSAIANIIIDDTSDITSVDWSLDGKYISSGNSVNVFTPLDGHTLSVVVETADSGTLDDSELITVNDNTPPELSINYIDSRSGAEIIQVSSKGKNDVSINYDVTDICDPTPTVSGVASAVHPANDGDSIIVKQQLVTTAVNVSATAVDASGNERHGDALLLIVD